VLLVARRVWAWRSSLRGGGSCLGGKEGGNGDIGRGGIGGAFRQTKNREESEEQYHKRSKAVLGTFGHFRYGSAAGMAMRIRFWVRTIPYVEMEGEGSSFARSNSGIVASRSEWQYGMGSTCTLTSLRRRLGMYIKMAGWHTRSQLHCTLLSLKAL